jgi:chaperonin GroES
MKVKPLYDRVLLKRLEEQEVVKGGIIIPDTAKEKPLEAKVIAVGKGRIEGDKIIPLEVKAGDKVLIGKFSGTDVTVDDEEYVIVREEEILAKVS